MDPYPDTIDRAATRVPSAGTYGDISYRLTLDPARCHTDPRGLLQIAGVIANEGPVAIAFGTNPSAPLRIGARRTFASGRPPEDCGARGVPGSDPLLPGTAAPFVLRMPLPDWAADPGGLDLALVCPDHSWLSDHGHPSTAIAMQRQDPSCPEEQETDMSDIQPLEDRATDTPDTIADPVLPDHDGTVAADIPKSLGAYQQARLGVGPLATLDDLWNCYRLLLNRPADPYGFEIYVRGVQDGVSVASLTEMFIESDEFAQRLRAPRLEAPTRVKVNGLSLYVPPPQTPAERHVIATGEHKPHLLGAMASVLAPDQFVLDIGAGVGAFTILAARRVGAGGRVVALEPDPALLRLLLANVTASGFTTVDALPFCAADGDGFVSLWRRGAIHTARNVSNDDLTSGSAVDVVYARCLDSILPEAQRVDVVKLALDGFDHRAMLGAKGLLTRHRPHLFGEFAPGLLAEFSGIEPIGYLHFLRDCGYDAFTAITRDSGPVDLGSDIEKLAAMPSRLGTAAVDFYAQGQV